VPDDVSAPWFTSDGVIERPIDGQVVRVPKDVGSALSERHLIHAFETLSPGERRSLIHTVESAATPATRQRRIEELLDRLRP
jgi:uncharacterized protein YdeI (YjbR/CyaY-like superfamily)